MIVVVVVVIVVVNNELFSHAFLEKTLQVAFPSFCLGTPRRLTRKKINGKIHGKSGMKLFSHSVDLKFIGMEPWCEMLAERKGIDYNN